ncbi:type IV conjugative transfer system coupling protein TraD [Salmonella enterica]|uniref:type IV conjugative transfer system coupling protein TraD n=4 Tax=Salmonella enterica TaxID=28901 RepID=UPI0009AEFB22|nr:type IV conjugative transfer system coupling protein TraD [Salmonella enterica]ECF7044236.1 type IV conjugative transfer system coupling protein TraD [Salmonella enterica subsp. enterica]EBD0851576.1 type IV conjugative transfer system coupling protein TraD [Salmonella enterica]EBF2434821.1 type IV conjugative transfer system coupling protein TraD [Salmonella enterica]EBN7034033.1 type IV conjugative transfer system coupling protein TraD [Salmonella enterica]ECE2168133.1 type IV conjugative
MSSTKHITQGGQVFSYMLNMFMQVNRRISFWLLNAFILLVPLIFWFRLPWETIRNGGLYWWLRIFAGGEKALYRVPPVYEIPFNGKVLNATSEQILADAYMRWAGEMCLQELYLSLFWASVAVLVIAFLVYRFLRRLGERQARDERMGGRELTDDVKAVAREMKRRGEASPLRIDGLPLMLNSEVQNLLMYGTPGSGKSNTINKLLRQLRAQGDMVIVYDKGCSLVKKHFNERDDVLLNALDRRCAYWDMFREFQTIPDFDSASSTLIPMGTKEDPFWQSSARTIFSAVAYRQKKSGNHSYNALLRTLLAIDLKALREYLAGTEASNLVEEKVEKTAISIRSVLTNYVKALRYLQGIERSGKKPFTIRDWMSSVNDPQITQHSWLWITSNARQHESLKPLISMWLAQAANCLLEMGENQHRRVWFIYDELPSLNKLPELPGVLAEARKFGGCFVLGFQAKAQMDYTYGKDFADAMLGLVNTRFFFRNPSRDEAEWVQGEIGQTRDRVFSEQYSYGADTVRDGVSFSKDEEDRYLVNYTDVQTLPNLSCYVTFPGDYPAVRMSMRYEKLKDCAEELQMRDINDSLAPEIEAQLAEREREDGDISRLMAVLDGTSVAGVTETADNTPPVSTVAAPVVTSVQPSPIAPVSATTGQVAVAAATSAVVASAAATAASGDSNPVEEAALCREDDGIVDMDTGEVLYPGDTGYEELDEKFNRAFGEAVDQLREDERNLVFHARDERECGGGDQPEPGEW